MCVKEQVERLAWYNQHPDRYTARGVLLMNRRARRRHWLGKYKIHKGCCVCGYKDHAVALHFDHIEPKIKRAAIAHMMAYSLKALTKEIRKCRVLCANCHYVKTDRGRR